jgi:hypothetical protein
VEWVVVVIVAVVVYAAIFFVIRANVRRLVAMRPDERAVSVRRQLIASSVAAFAMLVIALVIASD